MPTDANPDSEDILDRIRRLQWCDIDTQQSRGPKDDYSSRQAQFEVCLAFVTSRFDDDWVFNGRRYATHPPQRNKANRFGPSLAPDPFTIDSVESARNSNWYVVHLAARRVLTFLEQQPEVDSGRLGV